MRDTVVTAAEGRIRWGYHSAALLRGCAVARTADVWTMSATVVEVDPVRVAQTPLVFVIVHQKGAWSWPVQDVQIAGDVLSARLGPPTR